MNDLQAMPSSSKNISSTSFEYLASSLDGVWDPGLPLAAARAGCVGLLNLISCREPARASRLAGALQSQAPGRCGLLLRGRIGAVEEAALQSAGTAEMVVFSTTAEEPLREALRRGRQAGRRIGVIVTSEHEARLAELLGADFILAKGNEAGGRVGEETSFVLLQRLLRRMQLPVYAWGGIGLRTAAACRVAGAAGVLLDWQLAL